MMVCVWKTSFPIEIVTSPFLGATVISRVLAMPVRRYREQQKASAFKLFVVGGCQAINMFWFDII